MEDNTFKCLEHGITKNQLHCTLPMYDGRLGLSWFFVNCYALFYRVASLWHTSSRTCVISRGKCLLDWCQTQSFLAVTGLWCSGKVCLLASKKKFSDVVVTSHSSCVFLYLFSSANISLVRFVLHLQDRNDDVLENAKLASPSINCDWFTCRYLCGL